MLQDLLWGQLVLVLLFSFLTGLELREYQQKFHAAEPQLYIGTVRTHVFVGLLGFVFYLIHPNFFLVGFIALTTLYALLYWQKLHLKQSSILSFIILALNYSYAPLLMSQPLWLVASVFVITVLVLGSKDAIHQLVDKVSNDEMTTLAKLVLLSVVILPLLPQETIYDWLPVSPFKIWLAVVVVSSVSYLGYISQRYLFPNQGVLVTGIFGGLYSSTATTVVLSKKSIEYPRLNYKMTAAILIATGLMYLRLVAIAAVFNWEVALELVQPMFGLAFIIFIISFVFVRLEGRSGNHYDVVGETQHNPLELKVAFIFAGLFVLMAVSTHWVTQYFGADGLRYLSLIVGFTDIDPYVLSILNGQYATTNTMIASGVLIAAGSNNLLKALYALVFSEAKTGRFSSIWLFIFGVVTIGIGWLYA